MARRTSVYCKRTFNNKSDLQSYKIFVGPASLWCGHSFFEHFDREQKSHKLHAPQLLFQGVGGALFIALLKIRLGNVTSFVSYGLNKV